MLINPCDLNVAQSNTGIDCSAAMKASAMIIVMPHGTKWTDADITAAGSFTAFLNTKISAAPALRWYPIFGNNAPIASITESNESDVLETLDDGSQSFIRYGMYNRTFLTTKGGLSLASHLMGLRGSSYDFIEVDIIGQVASMQNADASYSGFPVNLMYAPASELANLKTTFKNKFMISFSPKVYIQQGKIFASDATEDILSVTGLKDTQVTAGTTTQTATNIFVGVSTVGAKTDLVALYPGVSGIAQISNFIVKKKSDGTVVTISAAAIVGGEVQLTGTFTTGTDYTVALAAPAVMSTNGVPGYDGVITATITIP
jgi:hypothetical protein